MTREEVVKYIRDTEGRFFKVRFIKRTDGSLREMLARTGVRKYVKGTGASYSFQAHGLIPVFDVEADDHKGAYRSIPIDGITEVMIHGDWEKVQ
jgi:hypothetical protein